MSSSWPAWTIIGPEDSLNIETPLTPLKKRNWRQLFLSNKYLTWGQERNDCRRLPHFHCVSLKPDCCPFLCKVTICLLWILASKNFTFGKRIISISPLAVLLTACLQLIPLERWPRLLQFNVDEVDRRAIRPYYIRQPHRTILYNQPLLLLLGSYLRSLWKVFSGTTNTSRSSLLCDFMPDGV